MRTPHSALGLIVLAAAATILTLGAAGCAGGSGYETLVAASDTAANQTIGPRYERYVIDDASLTAEQRASYLGELHAWRRAVSEAKQDADSNSRSP